MPVGSSSSTHRFFPPASPAIGFAFDSSGVPGDAADSTYRAAPPTPPVAPPQPASDSADLWAWEAGPGPGPPDPFHDDWKHWPDRGGGGVSGPQRAGEHSGASDDGNGGKGAR